MHDAVNEGAKIATVLIILMFIISIGITLIMVGKAFFDKTTNAVERPINTMADTDLYYISSYGGIKEEGLSSSDYGKPVPVADVMRWLISHGNAGYVSEFKIYTRDTVNPDLWDCQYMYVKTDSDPTVDGPTALQPYMARKAYISWERDMSSNLYDMEVYID